MHYVCKNILLLKQCLWRCATKLHTVDPVFFDSQCISKILVICPLINIAAYLASRNITLNGVSTCAEFTP